VRPFALLLAASLGPAASLGFALGCASMSATPPPADATGAGFEPFSGERAFAQLEKIVALGARVGGTPEAAAVHAFVRSELEAQDLEVHEDAFEWKPGNDGSPVWLANLWADVPGTEPGLFVLATPLDKAPVPGAGANEGASGAALLLELARTLRERPLAYTVRLLFLDGELLDPNAPFLGSEHAHLVLSESGELEQVRLLVYLHQVADRDLEIRRDQLSDRKLRDRFFHAAQKTGHEDVFPFTAPYDELRLGHAVFREKRFPHVVAIADMRYGGTEYPGEHWRTEADDLAQCSPESLAAVGAVVRGGLEAAAAHQRVVDRVAGAAASSGEGPP
jgi:hypothetical protein